MRHFKLRGGADDPSCTLRSFRRAENFFTLIGYDYMPKLTLTALLTKCLLLQSAVHTKINNVTVIVFHTSISDISFAIISYTFFPSNFFALNVFFFHIKRFEAVTSVKTHITFIGYSWQSKRSSLPFASFKCRYGKMGAKIKIQKYP